MALIILPTNACGSQTDTIPLISSCFPYVKVAYSTCFRLTTKETTICRPKRPCYTNVGHSERLHVYNLVSLVCKFLRFIYLDNRLHDSMVVSSSEFVSLTLERMCNPDTSFSGSDFSNLCRVIISLLSTACTYIWMVTRSCENACLCLIVDVVENWV